MRRGEMMGFNGCLGYDYHPENKSITVNEAEAETVRYIFDRYIEGYGAYTIAKELTALGKVNKKGQIKWTDSGVRGIIKNEKYKDESEWVCMAESESEQKERFLKIWTFKEAYSKMTGDGIALCLKQPYFQGLKNLNVIEKSFEEYRICVVKK